MGDGFEGTEISSFNSKDELIGRGFGKFAVEEFDYYPHDCWDIFVEARFNGLGPFLSIGVCNVVGDL